MRGVPKHYTKAQAYTFRLNYKRCGHCGEPTQKCHYLLQKRATRCEHCGKENPVTLAEKLTTDDAFGKFVIWWMILTLVAIYVIGVNGFLASVATFFAYGALSRWQELR